MARSRKYVPARKSQHQPKNNSLWNTVLGFVKKNYGKLLIGLLAASASLWYRTTNASQNTTLLQDPNLFPSTDPTAACEGFYFYKTNPENLTLDSYTTIFLAHSHENGPEKKVGRCIDALSNKGDVVLTEIQEQNKSIACSKLHISKKGLHCQGWEPPKTYRIYSVEKSLKVQALSIAKEIYESLKSFNLNQIYDYLAEFEKVGDKSYFDVNEISLSEFRELKHTPEFQRHIVSKVANTIKHRLKSGENFDAILKDIIKQGENAQKEMIANIKNEYPLLAERNTALAEQIKARKDEFRQGKRLFVTAGLVHLAKLKDHPHLHKYIDDAHNAIYSDLDQFADTNPYAVLAHEHPDFDFAGHVRLTK